MTSLSEAFRNWLLEPVLTSGGKIMAAVDALNAVLDAQYEAVLPALTSVKAELTRVNELLANGASAAEIADAVSRANASTNRIVEAVRDVVESDETPVPDTSLPEVPAPDLPESPVEVPVVDEPVESPANPADEDIPGDGLGAQ